MRKISKIQEKFESMRTDLKINGRLFSRCATPTNARNWAAALYQTMTDILLTGSSSNYLCEAAIKNLTRPDEDFIVTVDGRNWEEFIPEEEWISNLNKSNKAS